MFVEGVAAPDRVVGQGQPTAPVENGNEVELFRAGAARPDVQGDVENIFHDLLRLGENAGVDRLKDEPGMLFPAPAGKRKGGIDQAGGNLLVRDDRTRQDEVSGDFWNGHSVFLK